MGKGYEIEELVTSTSAILDDVSRALLRAAIRGEMSEENIKDAKDKLEWAKSKFDAYSKKAVSTRVIDT